MVHTGLHVKPWQSAKYQFSDDQEALRKETVIAENAAHREDGSDGEKGASVV